MNYSNIIPYDTANGEGIRTSLFVSGCTNNCQGCFNKESQDFNYGKPYTEQTEKEILEYISKPYVAGLSILGGDPLCQDANGLQQLISLCIATKDLGKSIWLWTGYTWEYLTPTVTLDELNANIYYREALISLCDIVVDGPFIESKKDLTLAFRGSYNQRIIDVKKSLDKGKVVLYNKYN